MKQIRVNKCLAGVAIDAAVARAQGLHIDNLAGYWKDDTGNNIYPACIGCDGIPTWHPSGKIEAAWPLAEILSKEGYEFYISNWHIGDCYGWSANWRRRSGMHWRTSDSETAPLAICRAFLKAKGIEFVEIPK